MVAKWLLLEHAAPRTVVGQLRTHVQLRRLKVDGAVREVRVDGVLQHARARRVGADGLHLLVRGFAGERVDGVPGVVGAALGIRQERQELEHVSAPTSVGAEMAERAATVATAKLVVFMLVVVVGDGGGGGWCCLWKASFK